MNKIPKFTYLTLLVAALVTGYLNFDPKLFQSSPGRLPASVEQTLTTGKEDPTPKPYQNKALFVDNYRDSIQIRWDLLRAETQEINAIMFIFREDAAGLAHLAELRRAARKGVKVRLIFDDYGATGAKSAKRLSPEMVKHLMDEGIEVKVFHQIDKRAILNPARYMKRGHEKVYHFKGQDTFLVGDRNWSKTYFGFQKDGNDKFLSRDLLVTGPETKVVEDHFEDLIKSSAVEDMIFDQPLDPVKLEDAKRRLDGFESGLESRKLFSQSKGADYWKEKARPVRHLSFIGDKVNKPVGTVQRKLFDLIKGSKSNVLIESPYVILNKESMDALNKAQKNGSKIEVITNSGELTDEVWVPPAADSDLRKLESKGIPVFENVENRIFHTKSYVVDDRYVIFGSNNFDNRSLKWDREAAVLIDDPEMAKDLRVLIERDKSFTKRFDVTQPSFRSRDCIRWGLSQLIRSIL